MKNIKFKKALKALNKCNCMPYHRLHRSFVIIVGFNVLLILDALSIFKIKLNTSFGFSGFNLGLNPNNALKSENNNTWAKSMVTQAVTFVFQV